MFDWLNDLIDSVFQPPCATDPCSSGYIESAFLGDYTSGIDDAFGTQAMYQPAAEAFVNDPFAQSDAFSNSDSF